MDEEERMNTYPRGPENRGGVGGSGCMLPFVIIIGGLVGFGTFIVHFV